MRKTLNPTWFAVKAYSRTTNWAKLVVKFVFKRVIKSLAKDAIIASIITCNCKEFVLNFKLFKDLQNCFRKDLPSIWSINFNKL
jgi:hypothetical protein